MNSNHIHIGIGDGDSPIRPDDLARKIEEQIFARQQAQLVIDDLPRIQRLAANRSPSELRNTAIDNILALTLQHTAEISSWKEVFKEEAEKRSLDPDLIEGGIESVVMFALERDRLNTCLDLLGNTFSRGSDDDEPPPPEAIEKFVDRFQQPETEEDGE